MLPINKAHLKLLTLFICLFIVSCQNKKAEHQTVDSNAKPKLIVQITIDQLRGDLPLRFMDKMSENGFKYFYTNGVVYNNAHHAHSNTETIVGHASLATGAYPSTHGMIANVWLNRETGVLSYNIEDPRFSLLSADADVNQKTEIDPTQKKARSSGRSPANIKVSTFSDELKLASNGKAKVFGVSVKDRGAVSFAGHTGKAFWFSKKSGEFVTSNYYYKSYPEWVKSWNAEKHQLFYADTNWELSNSIDSYLFGENDNQEWEVDLAGFGRTFPHKFGKGDGKYYNTLLTISPAGDEITSKFAQSVITNEKLGQDDITDFLSVSFSSTDYVGHMFGPSSLEMEDNLLRLDKTLAQFIQFIDENVGLENTLIVLSADHGSPEAPGYLNSLGMEASTVDFSQLDKDPAIERLKQRFGIGQELISEFFPPYLYLNHDVINERKLDLSEVQKAVAEEVAKFKIVEHAVTSADLNAGSIPTTNVLQKVINNHDPRRAGDIYLVFKPHSFVNNFDGLHVASYHGSVWNYDTYVPVIFAGHTIKNKTIHRRIETVDIAPTLSALMGIKPPSGTDGFLLPEVLEK
ncbi:MAG: alkaline phosphatase [Bacteroidetes bacterium MedPE-SWsnd-G2]|nr:MAG: alkaline phosphatase [Bacteroidetes bacterium MedPE-SWsnd-G2]